MSCKGLDCGCWYECNKKKRDKFLLEKQAEARKLMSDPTVTVTKNYSSLSEKGTEQK